MKKAITLFILMAMTAITANAQTKQEVDSIYEASRELVNNGQVHECRPLALQAMDMYKKLYGEISDDYINALNVYAVSFGQEKDFKKAAEWEQQVMNLCEKLGHEHPRINLFYENMGYFAFMADDYKNSTKYWELALPYQEKYSDKYGRMIQGMAMMYENLGDTEGLARMWRLMDDHNRHELTLPCEELKCMMERAEYYTGTGDNTQAKEWYLKAIRIAESDEKIEVYEAYGQFLGMTMRDFATGAEYMLSAANLRKERDGENEAYINTLYKAGVYYSMGKQFQQAVDCYLPVITYYQKHDSRAAKNSVAKCQKNLGNAYMGLKNYGKAKECFQKALTYYETYEKDSDEYPQMLARLASAEEFNKDYNAAIEHYQQAMEIFEERGMMENYSNAAASLQLCYTYAGMDVEVDTKESAVKAERDRKLDQSIKELKESLQITHDYLGGMAYASTLGTIAGFYYLKEDYNYAVEYYKQYLPELRNAIRAEFQLQSEAERMATWNQEKSNLQELEEMFINLPEENINLINDLTSLVYDGTLLSKGILLNSSIEFEKVLAEQGNDQLKSVYAQIQANEERIEWLRDNAASDADLETIIHLSQENQALQLQLYRGCKELADFTDYISYDWKAVQQVLTPSDVAIEFVSVNPVVRTADDIMVALVLTKDMPNPIAIKIWDNEHMMECGETEFCEQMQYDISFHSFNKSCDTIYLKSLLTRLNDTIVPCQTELSLYLQSAISKMKEDTSFVPRQIFGLMQYKQILEGDLIFSNPEAGNLIWGALSQYLKGKDRIFFSADGCLNHIAIEYLQYNGKPLSERFKVYRLSSTKELCYRHQAVSMDRIALFGDINYNEVGTTSKATQSGLLAMRAAENEFANLGNTKREVDEIQTILKSKAKSVTKLTDTEASQTAFFSLSDSKVNLIHVATHGVYSESKGATENESMENSILAFAGANLYDDTHDGIVTAADIAKMNLRQCDLAVLSACETGLGKLGDDGVFGLQRGFKNAGVHTLLMSIKNVYDNTTADMMISFYRHLTEGSSKREALVKAQQEIRDKGYTDAKYWAAFILLDAIDD